MTHRYREQMSSHQWGEPRKEGQDRASGLRGANYGVQTFKLQGHIVQHKEYNQYLIVTMSRWT